METFNYPYHTVSTENPESGSRANFGGSYTFTTPPTDPDQRKFSLTLNGMRYITNDAGNVIDNINQNVNMYHLIKFYQRHKLWKTFKYIHPVHGELNVKFSKPLVEPEAERGGFGVVKEFSIELIEVL